MKIKVKKLNSNAIIPKYAKLGDAGMDLVAVSKHMYNGKTYIEYKTGLALEIPEGYVGLIFPRSSLSNKSLILSNHVGVIDSGYRGEISFRFKKIEDGEEYQVGDKIGQLIIIPYPSLELEEVEELSNTERGNSGFGSSGN